MNLCKIYVLNKNNKTKDCFHILIFLFDGFAWMVYINRLSHSHTLHPVVVMKSMIFEHWKFHKNSILVSGNISKKNRSVSLPLGSILIGHISMIVSWSHDVFLWTIFLSLVTCSSHIYQHFDRFANFEPVF